MGVRASAERGEQRCEVRVGSGRGGKSRDPHPPTAPTTGWRVSCYASPPRRPVPLHHHCVRLQHHCITTAARDLGGPAHAAVRGGGGAALISLASRPTVLFRAGEPRRAASLPTMEALPSRPTCPGPHLSCPPVRIHRLQRAAARPHTPLPYFDAFGGGGSAPDEGVDLGGLNLVHAAHGLRDLPLVRARVDDEDEGVVVCVRDRAGREIYCTVDGAACYCTPCARAHCR